MYRKPRETGRVYTFQPVGLDVWDARPFQPKPGTRVRKTQPYGTPKNGTMKMAYVEDADTGAFYGLVLLASLTRKGATK